MANFLYLFWSKKDDWKPDAPEQMERRMTAWMHWIDELQKAGHLVKTSSAAISSWKPRTSIRPWNYPRVVPS